MNPWAKAIQETLNSGADKVPKGWLTREQTEPLFNCRAVQARVKLKQLIAAGRCEVQNFRVKTEKRICPIPHYKLK